MFDLLAILGAGLVYLVFELIESSRRGYNDGDTL